MSYELSVFPSRKSWDFMLHGALLAPWQVRTFRAAQRLSAPLCFPFTWRLELDRERSPHFPTTVTKDGNYNVRRIQEAEVGDIWAVCWDFS